MHLLAEILKQTQHSDNAVWKNSVTTDLRCELLSRDAWKSKAHVDTISDTKDHAFAGPFLPDCHLM